MNTRERFLKIAHFERKNDIFIPSYEGASPWKETLKRWHKEGLPEEIQNTHYYNNGFLSLAGWTNLSEYLNLDRLEQFNPGLRRGSTLFPPFEYKVLEENERHQIAINEEGIKIKIMKDSVFPQNYIYLKLYFIKHFSFLFFFDMSGIISL